MNVLLVDDNYQMLQFMNNCIQEAKSDIRVIGMCENGEQALQVVRQKKPDILITDIDMPGMNGLELIRKIKELHPEVHSLIISSYDDFHYAQQAVRLLVNDYMLKESIEPDTLLDAIDRLSNKIKQESRKLNDINQWKSIIEQNKFTIKKQWFKSMLHSPMVEENVWMDKCNDYGFDLSTYSYIPVFGRVMNLRLALEQFESPELLMYAIDNITNELSGEKVECFAYEEFGFFLFFPIRPSIKNNQYDEVKKILSQLQVALTEYIDVKMAFVYEKTVQNIHDLKKVTQKLCCLKQEWFYMDEMAVKGYHELSTNLTTSPVHEDYTNTFHTLKTFIDDNEETEKVIQWINHWGGSMSLKKYDPDSIKFLIYKVMTDLDYSYNSVSDKVENIHQEIMEAQTIEQLQEYVYRFLLKLIQSKETRKKTEKQCIWKAIQYVENNVDQKITLEGVSQHLYLNPSYFSRLFKKETGESFIEYVNRFKMDKAIQHLTKSNATIEDIAVKLGYDSTSYFIKIFKKYYHMTPVKYRKKH
ncbi:two-component system response regulator YesN [Evansella vedderi]|uniref:Two-component system response regulator YesN n=1 Tax=Evansella vedderi TaxID=38282 RepID=A0ABU0A303_9BACI|nr:response regulator [Evansella vedderi]MDQ0256735.1 two-component system response regulator YesN [Evansella vedderi]